MAEWDAVKTEPVTTPDDPWAVKSVAPAAAPSLASRADDLLSNNPLYSAEKYLVKNAAAPLVNTLVVDPIRNLAADVVGAVRSPPTSKKGREGFWKEREGSLGDSSVLQLPQTETGEHISTALGIPGKAIGGIAKAFGRGFGVEETLGPAATIAGDALPLAGGLAASMRGRATPGASVAAPAAAAARSAGYRLPPEAISEAPSMMERLLSGDAGKAKKLQSFSVDNQKNTNALAAKTVGLKPGTMLTEAAYEAAEKPAIAAYEAVKAAIPETVLGADPAYRAAVENVGVRNAEMERAFPEAVPNPHVAQLKETLLRNGVESTDAVMKKIADLRSDASRNFRKENDAQLHALGYAQRQAASVLEDAIERSIGYGPDRVTAHGAVHEAMQEVAKARQGLAGERVSSKGMPAAEAELAAAQADLAAKMGTVTPADVAAGKAMRQRVQDARQLFAKIHDLRDATNLANGDVLARRVSALRRTQKRPLTGEMKAIADAYDSFTPNMQSPSAFGGGVEAFSILDLVAGATAAGAGHPLAAGIIAGRYPARALLRSDWMQDRMFNPPRYGANPATAVPAAELVMPHEDDGVARAVQ